MTWHRQLEHTLQASLHVCPIITITITITLSPHPVPIIDSVEVAVLSLFEVEVNISLLTNGGQSVTQYIVSPFTCALNRPSLEGKAFAFRKWTSLTDQLS